MPATAASGLLRAYRERASLAVAADSAPADAAAAYAVQREIWRAVVGSRRPHAWKVGAPTRDTLPSAAAIFPQRIALSPARFSRADFFGLGIEVEIALRFGRDLPARATPWTRAEILDAIASAHVAMELVDTRLADPEAAGPLWRLADNLLNGGLVLGDAIANWRDLDYNRLRVRILADGQPIAETVGRPPLDDIFYCLPWWLEHAGGARAGDIVTTGAWSGMHPVELPAAVGVEFVGLGSVAAEIR
jgi:2-keto-4-pentenoate hydratase